MSPTFAAHEENYAGMYYLRQLESEGHVTRILSQGDKARPKEIVLLGDQGNSLSNGWELGCFQIAAHRFLFVDTLPEYVTGPFVVKVRLHNGYVRKRVVRALARKYTNFFADPSQLTPWGTPTKISSGWLRDWIELSQHILHGEPVPQRLALY